MPCQLNIGFAADPLSSNADTEDHDGLDMTATDLTRLRDPEPLRAAIADIDPDIYLHGHTISIDQNWWRTALSTHGLDHTGLIGPSISRSDLFALADAATDTREGATRLLWNATAWGTGVSGRNGRKRIHAFAADPDRAADLLRTAAALARTDPEATYALLRPRDRTNAINYLGPAFFTKYLYFAGGGDPTHPCHILDQRVANTLRRLGWTSLPPKDWTAAAYQRYNQLLRQWADATGASRTDIIERWLFEQGGTWRKRSGDKPH